jgi:hypothetical protein
VYGPTTGLDVEGTADTCETAVELGAGRDVLENDEHNGRMCAQTGAMLVMYDDMGEKLSSNCA